MDFPEEDLKNDVRAFAGSRVARCALAGSLEAPY
jgi:hypothetical protein